MELTPGICAGCGGTSGDPAACPPCGGTGVVQYDIVTRHEDCIPVGLARDPRNHVDAPWDPPTGLHEVAVSWVRAELALLSLEGAAHAVKAGLLHQDAMPALTHWFVNTCSRPVLLRPSLPGDAP